LHFFLDDFEDIVVDVARKFHVEFVFFGLQYSFDNLLDLGGCVGYWLLDVVDVIHGNKPPRRGGRRGREGNREVIILAGLYSKEHNS